MRKFVKKILSVLLVFVLISLNKSYSNTNPLYLVMMQDNGDTIKLERIKIHINPVPISPLSKLVCSKGNKSAVLELSKYNLQIHRVVHKRPYYPGCFGQEDEREKQNCAMQKMYQYLNDNVSYPLEAKKSKIAGTVVIAFIVEREGRLSNVHVLKDIGFGCGQEVVKAVKTMPMWMPGKINDEAVRTYYTIAFKFKFRKG